MTEILQANIFFVIASIATVVFCIFVCLILYQILKIVRTVRKIIERIEEGSEVIAEDVAFARSWMRGGLSSLFGMFTGFGGGRATRKRKGSSILIDEE